MEVTVVGAGVIGLVTALMLEERGHRVRVVAATHPGTTSTVAGAIWFPYRAGPRERVMEWATVTRVWLEGLARDRATGVDMVTGYEITDDDPWWATGLDVERVSAPVIGEPLAWRYVAPRVEPAVFLAWVASKLSAPIERRTVVDLEAELGDIVVNCTGLGARELANDRDLSGLFGQVVVTELGIVDSSITITDDRDPDDMFYVIPRRDELVLGGCAIARESAAIDPAITERILVHAHELGLAVGRVKRVCGALRPVRPTVRLERSGRIIHNYGHGGAGFTLCRGCAYDLSRYLM